MTTQEQTRTLFHALYQVAHTVNSSLDIMQVLETIVASTSETLEARACSLRLLAPDGKHLLFGAAHGLSAAYRGKGPVLLEQSQVDRLALASGETVYVQDAGADERFQYPGQAREEGIVSVLLAPLCVQNQPVGVLRIYTADRHTFSDEELVLAKAIASLSALAIENARLYERLDRNYHAALDFSQREFD